MGFDRRFNQQVSKFLERMGEEDDDDMTQPPDSLAVVERCVAALGLTEIVHTFLGSVFQAEALADLSQGDLDRALRFISALCDRPQRGAIYPIPEGTEGDGEIFMVRGRFRWGDRRPGTSAARFGME